MRIRNTGLTLFVGLFPKHLVFGFKYLPFALAPAAFLFYEVDEFREGVARKLNELHMSLQRPKVPMMGPGPLMLHPYSKASGPSLYSPTSAVPFSSTSGINSGIASTTNIDAPQVLQALSTLGQLLDKKKEIHDRKL